MIEKNALFYMANLYPEIGRLFSAFDSGKKEVADLAKDRALKVVDSVLAAPDVSKAGREEWSTVRNLIEGYAVLDVYSRQVLEKFGQPFSEKFMKQYSAGMASVS
ncbi:MAG: hypothetical protein RL641_184 [Candidatus Parcubacteria bacterium]|jgi:hypothetical protein